MMQGGRGSIPDSHSVWTLWSNICGEIKTQYVISTVSNVYILLFSNTDIGYNLFLQINST